ncbi:DUF1571 domain-containing protein [Rufibacter latericius]|nr:DUF1571 domain-containing protein [Rufibacter latericius]
MLVVPIMGIGPVNRPAAITSKEIIDKMFVSIKQLRTVKFIMKNSERRENRNREGEQHIKINISPFWLYAYIAKPSKGVEALWRQGENNNNVLVHPNSFPYLSLNLDPNGSLVRSGSHHNLFAANPNYTADIIRDTYKKVGQEFSEIFKYEGDAKFDGKDCYRIVIDYTPYKLYNYRVKQGEDVFSIAQKLYLNEFKIKELNKLKDFTGLKAGQVLVLPNAYAKKTILLIDKKTYLPLVQVIYDELGFFERYEYHDLQVNPSFKKDEFSKDFPAYHF